MPLLEFSKNDIFRNTLITHPKYHFRVKNGKIILNDSGSGFGNELDLNIPDFVIFEGMFDFSSEEQSFCLPLI